MVLFFAFLFCGLDGLECGRWIREFPFLKMNETVFTIIFTKILDACYAQEG